MMIISNSSGLSEMVLIIMSMNLITNPPIDVSPP